MKKNRWVAMLIVSAIAVLLLGSEWDSLGVMLASSGTVASPAELRQASPGDSTTLIPIADAYLYSASPTVNYGSATGLSVGSQTTGTTNRAVIRFNLAGLPSNAILDSADFRAYLASSDSVPSLYVGVYSLLGNWLESVITWANQPPATSIGKSNIVGTTPQYYEWEVTSQAQFWLDNPANNFGLELRSESEGSLGWRSFASRESTHPPQLVIVYHLPPCSDPQEPNDSFASAFSISPATEYLGCIPTPSDTDYFRFDVPPQTVIQVELFNLPADYNLYLYSPSFSLLDSSANSGTTSELVTYTTGPSGGQYYAKVQSSGASDLYNPYALKLTLTPLTLQPDLVIQDLWEQAGQVCYTVENSGLGTAPQGHSTSLTVDGGLVATHLVGVDLAPGAQTQGCFTYSWLCSSPQDTLAVCADADNDVQESDETNNCTQETWECDTTPPVILTGPTISKLTSSSATVSWTTNELSDSAVLYGSKAGEVEGQETSTILTTAHQVELTGLNPSTTYHYLVRSADQVGNTVASREAFFTTSAASTPPPSILDVSLTRMPGKLVYYNMAASVPLTTKIERLDFYMDGEFIGTAYAPKPGGSPGMYEFPLIPSALGIALDDFFINHTIEAVAIGPGGSPAHFPVDFQPPYECADIDLDFVQPFEDDILYTLDQTTPPGTEVRIEVLASYADPDCILLDPYGDPMEIVRCRMNAGTIQSVEFRVDGDLKCTRLGDASNRYICDWNASNLSLGDYQIRVDAIANETCKQTASRYLTIAQGSPSLDVSREVAQLETAIEVTLDIANHGTIGDTIYQLTDHITGFQPISKTEDLGAFGVYGVSADCAYSGVACEITLDLPGTAGHPGVTIQAGNSLTLSYLATPILYTDQGDTPYAVGDELLLLSTESQNVLTFDRLSVATPGGKRLSAVVEEIQAASDMIILTKPANLFAFFTTDETNALLSLLAEFARQRSAMLGYINSFDGYSTTEELKDLIRDWGASMEGSFGVANHYLDNGYLLIVGETPVIPSDSIYDPDIQSTTDDWSTPIFPVRLVDNSYADMCGNLKPELTVARLIGDSAAELSSPLEISLLDSYECGQALVVSGLDEDEPEKQASFVNNAEDIADILTPEVSPPFASVGILHWSSLDSKDWMRIIFNLFIPGTDALFYTNHGGHTSWSGSVLDTGDFPVDFVGSHPLVAAFACNTGYYEGIDSIAEAFLESQAGGYIGSTELASRPLTINTALLYVDRWPANGTSAAKALRDTKRTLLDGSMADLKRLWSMEFNYYGDPKYGMCPAGAAAETARPQSSMAPPSSLEITIPDYQVTSRDGIDTVRIPGGLMFLEPGLPMIPMVVVTQDYPHGFQVQEVLLTSRSGLTTATGLNLPITSDDSMSAGESGFSAQPAAGGYPEEDFEWTIDVHPDGSTTLVIRIYPFYYDPTTTDVQFYQSYSFAIDYTLSNMEISSLTTDKLIYAQGEPVSVGFIISGTAVSGNLVVETVIRDGSSYLPVEGLLLRSLAGFSGLATFLTSWDSSEPGIYVAEATLRRTNGQVLDRKTAQFTVGLTAGEITMIQAIPIPIEPGDHVELAFIFKNTGTVPLTGTAVIQVQTGAGALIHEFTQDYGNLAAGDSVNFTDVWDTTGAAGGPYRLVFYVLYESMSTNPIMTVVNVNRQTFLPILVNGYH